MSINATQLAELIATHMAKVTVIGQGYVGIPLATEFARVGFRVTGIDTDPARVSHLNNGKSSTPDVSDNELQATIDNGSYTATSDFSTLGQSDVVLICVPTPLRKSKDPDISYVLNSAEQVAKYLRRGQLIILESTTYPGTTEELLLPLFTAQGLRAGEDFFLAFSPERIDPGNPSFRVKDIPKVVGGVTTECSRLAALFYRQIVGKVHTVSSPKVAELAKLYENVFRNVNIALANEFALMCRHLEVDTREVIDAAASKPFGFLPFYPGPGIGGHCIPIDPAYLAWKMRFNNYQARFIQLAEEINQSMPAYVVQLVVESLNRRQRCLKASRILVIGVAYKRGVADIRESPALVILASLMEKGATVTYADPYVPSIKINGTSLYADSVNDQTLGSADCVLILTDHPGVDYEKIVSTAAMVVDTRSATSGIHSTGNKVVRL